VTAPSQIVLRIDNVITNTFFYVFHVYSPHSKIQKQNILIYNAKGDNFAIHVVIQHTLYIHVYNIDLN